MVLLLPDVAGTMALPVLVRVVLQIPVVAVTVVLLVALALLRVVLLVPARRSTGTAGCADAAARSATEREVLLRVVLPVPVVGIPVVLLAVGFTGPTRGKHPALVQLIPSCWSR